MEYISKAALILTGLLTPKTDTTTLPWLQNYQTYILEFGKSYETKGEFMFRANLWLQKDELIQKWNANPNKTQTLAHNLFSDMTIDEFKIYNGLVPSQRSDVVATELSVDDLPESVNWVTKGAVSPVQNQRQCGSCWAFSAVGAIESAHYLKSNELVKLSEQQCVDCVKEDKGCNGGDPNDCFYYAEGDKMVTEKQYPYSGVADSCFIVYEGKIGVTKYHQVKTKSVE